MDALRKDLNQEKKSTKEKGKEGFRLGQKCDNLLENVKKLKDDLADLKGENKKLLKENRKNDKSKKNLDASIEPLGNISQSSSIIPIQTMTSTPQPISYFKSSFLNNNSNSSPSVSNITPLTTKPDSLHPESFLKPTLSCLKLPNSKSPTTLSPSSTFVMPAALLPPTPGRENTTPSSCSPRTPPGTPAAFTALSATARKLPPAYQQMILGVDEILKSKFPG